MKRYKLTAFLLMIFTVLFFSCDETSQDADPEPETLDFATEPSEDLTQMVEVTPSDFTWDFFSNNLIVTLVPGPMWSGEIVLSSFQVENGEVVNRSTTPPVETSADELADGLTTEEMFPGLVYIPGQEWVTSKQWQNTETWPQASKWVKTEHWTPSDQWVPGSMWTPSEIEQIARNEVDLSENQTMVVVYPHLAENSDDFEVITQPYGIIFTEEAATGSLEITTETGGTNPDDSYEVLVNDQTETIGANETITISDLEGADYSVELTGIADNCEVVNGENPRTVTITADQTTSTTFEVNCAEALSGALTFTSFRDGNANIYTISDDGTNIRQLTDHGELDGQAAISPGGTKIAFTSERDGNREIYLMNSDGSGLTRLTNNSVRDELPAWSPDGNQLAFSSQRDGVDDIFIMDSDGSNVTKVTTDPEVDTHPTWSPDGNTLAFQTLRDGDWTIYSISTDGSDATLLTESDAQSDRDPEYSPDGSQIAYSRNTDNGEEIFVMDSDGTNHTQITNNDSQDILPTWSPNGDFIGFQSNRAGGANIHIIGSDGSSPSRLTESGAFDEFPHWSPVE
ncbi:MAG: DUF5050 domain-containing protein [Balneolaceae bacterium]|nr:DUF5050 domain-containing protein [Balneolaceae bacterium]